MLSLVWGLTIVVGVVLLFIPRLRSLGVRILLCSICAIVCVAILPGVLVAVTQRWLANSAAEYGLFLAGFILAGPIGVLVGFVLARRVNARLGWSAPSR
jgi:hypothetical protein